MPKAPCLEARCPRFAAPGKSRCRVHASEQRKQTRSTFNAFYASRRWRITRRRKLFQDPLCELRHPGCEEIASEVHHEVPLEVDGSDRNRYTLAGLVSCCKPCHSVETRREQLTTHDRGLSEPAAARGTHSLGHP